MKKQNSMIVNIVRINLSLIVVHLLVFAAVSMVYGNRITEERNGFANTILQNEVSAFENERHRLNQLMALCINDTSFVFTISDRLDYTYFYSNAVAAAEKLSIIKKSLPYTKSVFAYSRASNLVIQDTGSIMKAEDYFAMTLPEYVHTAEEAAPQDGFQLYSGEIYYIKNLFDYGYVAIKIDPGKFANIGDNMSVGNSALIVDDTGELVIGKMASALGEGGGRELLEKDWVELEGLKYKIRRSPINDTGYIGILLTNSSEFTTPSQYFLVVTAVSLGVLAISSLVMILLNIRVYLPLRVFATRFGNEKNGNEISFIEDKIQEMLYENYCLSAQNAEAKSALTERVVLQYLLYGGQQIDKIYLNPLQEKYSLYHIAVLVVQNEKGDSVPAVLADLEKSAPAEYFQFIGVDKFVTAIVVWGRSPEAVAEILGKGFETLEGVQGYCGIAENCTDILLLHDQYQLALKKLMSSQINEQDGLNYDPDVVPLETSPLSGTISKTIYEYASNGAYAPLEELLGDLFIKQNQLRLMGCRELYQETIRILQRVTSEKKYKQRELPPLQSVYHTSLMYSIICDFIGDMKHQSTSDHIEMKDKISDYIKKNLTSDLSLELVADAFSITPVYLSSWFKKAFDVNFSVYISNMRMEEATKILRSDPSIKIYAVANLVGIENVTTFIRQFKAKTGTTPEQYRKNCSATAEE